MWGSWGSLPDLGQFLPAGTKGTALTPCWSSSSEGDLVTVEKSTDKGCVLKYRRRNICQHNREPRASSGRRKPRNCWNLQGKKNHYNLQRGLGSRQKAATALQKLVSSAHSWIHAEVTGYCPKEPLCVRELPLHSPSDRQEHQAGSRLHDPGHIHRETLSIID